MMLIIVLSTLVWLIYSFGRGVRPVIIANAIILALSLLLTWFKFTFPKSK